MTWLAVGSTAATLIGGAYASNQANKGAKGAANAVTDAQRQQYEQTRQDLMPFMEFGQGAIPQLQQLAAGDYSGFTSSPDYLAALEMGQNQLDHSAAARGGLFGGGNTRDTIKFGSGLAAQYLNQYRNSLFDQAGMGQNAAAQAGQFGANAANQIGNAQAGYYQQRGNNNAQLGGIFAGGLNNMLQGYGASRPAAARQSAYTGLGGQAPLAQTQPAFGNNYGNFGNWGIG